MESYRLLRLKAKINNDIYKYLFISTLLLILVIGLSLIHFNLLLIPVSYSVSILLSLLTVIVFLFLIFNIIFDRNAYKRNKGQKYMKDAKILILAGLQILKNDHEKLAKVLDINIELLENIILEQVTLKRADIDKIRQNFAQKIALSNFALGLENKLCYKSYLYNLSDTSGLCVVFLSLEQLKSVKTYGDSAKNELTQSVVERLMQNYKNAYIIACSDTEICLIFANKNKYQARQLKESIENSLKSPFTLELSGLTVAISGNAVDYCYPEDISSIQKLIELIDNKVAKYKDE